MQHTKIRKGNLKLYALTKIQKGKHENHPSLMLGQIIFVSNKTKMKQGDREKERKNTISPG